MPGELCSSRSGAYSKTPLNPSGRVYVHRLGVAIPHGRFGSFSARLAPGPLYLFGERRVLWSWHTPGRGEAQDEMPRVSPSERSFEKKSSGPLVLLLPFQNFWSSMRSRSGRFLRDIHSESAL